MAVHLEPFWAGSGVQLAYRLRDYPRPSAARESPWVWSNGLAPTGADIRPRWRCSLTPPLRSSDSELAEALVAATVAAHSEFRPAPQGSSGATPVAAASFAPGTLQIFGGRYCLHRVTKTEGARDRLVGVLCFASEPGVVNSPQVQKMFWGRSVHVAQAGTAPKL